MRFVLIDRLVELVPGVSAAAEKTFDGAEEFLADHFPGAPLVPGVLQIEAMAQTAGWLLFAGGGFVAVPLLVMVERAKFRRPVRPGETMRLDAVVDGRHEAAHAVRTSVRVGDAVVAEARLVFSELPSLADDGVGEWSRRTFAALGGEGLLARNAPA